MRFAALSIGAGAPPGDFTGVVAAVHRRVCVISLADENSLTIVAAEIGRLPRSITLDAPAGICVPRRCRQGADVAARGGIFRIGGGALSIDLRPATRWRSRLGDLGVDDARESVAQALEAARAALRRDGRGDALVGLAARALDALDRRDANARWAAAGEAMSALVGLGEGVTPAGDDYLVGYFAGLWACAARGTRIVWLSRRAARARGAIDVATGAVSRVYLEAALRRRDVGTAVSIVADAIAAGSDEAVVDGAAARALAVGHSSGACGLLGFLRACAAGLRRSGRHAGAALDLSRCEGAPRRRPSQPLSSGPLRGGRRFFGGCLGVFLAHRGGHADRRRAGDSRARPSARPPKQAARRG